MKTRYAKVNGCVPNPGRALNANALTKYYERDDIVVKLDDGNTVLTGHVCTDGRKFDYRDVYGTQQDWEYALVTQFSYYDTDGVHQVVEVDPRNPHPIKRSGVTNFGYVTKVLDKRWGVSINIDYTKGTMQAVGDPGSPIVGVLVQLI